MERDITGEYDPTITVDELVDEWISKAVIHHRGNMYAASRSLGMSRATLYRRWERMRFSSAEARELNVHG